MDTQNPNTGKGNQGCNPLTTGDPEWPLPPRIDLARTIKGCDRTHIGQKKQYRAVVTPALQ